MKSMKKNEHYVNVREEEVDNFLAKGYTYCSKQERKKALGLIKEDNLINDVNQKTNQHKRKKRQKK